jgi:hypothetical protein
MNSYEYKHDDDLKFADLEVDYIARMRIHIARNRAMSKNLYNVEQQTIRTIPWDKPPDTALSLKISTDSIMPLMRDWMKEKDSEIKHLKAQVTQQHQELIQKEIDLAVIRERFMTQKQRMQGELMIMRHALALANGKNKELLRKKDVSTPALPASDKIEIPCIAESIQGNTKKENTVTFEERKLSLVDNRNTSSCYGSTNSKSEINVKQENFHPNHQSTIISEIDSENILLRNFKKDNLQISNDRVDKETKSESKQQGSIPWKDPAEYEKKDRSISQNLASTSWIQGRKEIIPPKRFANADIISQSSVPFKSVYINTVSSALSSDDDAFDEDVIPWKSLRKVAPPSPHMNESPSIAIPQTKNSVIPDGIQHHDNTTKADLRATILDTSLPNISLALDNDDVTSICTSSVGTTAASSTYGEDRKFVRNQREMDPYGDSGIFTGVILKSTGFPHGVGRMVYDADGRVYNGRWRHGRWHGFGKATFANHDTYEGEFQCDQRHGHGIYVWSDGKVYDGEFQDDKRQGRGTFTWPDGAIYVGEFHNGKREGKGCYSFPQGGYYDGHWKNGRYHGFGGKFNFKN